jgi:hypothetical protein
MGPAGWSSVVTSGQSLGLFTKNNFGVLMVVAVLAALLMTGTPRSRAAGKSHSHGIGDRSFEGWGPLVRGMGGPEGGSIQNCQQPWTFRRRRRGPDMPKKLMIIPITAVFGLAVASYALASPSWKSHAGTGVVTTTPPIVLNQSAPVTVPQVTFTVTRTAVVIGQVLYVRMDCFNAAGAQVAYGLSLVYFDPSSPGNSVGTTDPLTVGGVSCTAYVTDKPTTGNPISQNAQITFAVASQ